MNSTIASIAIALAISATPNGAETPPPAAPTTGVLAPAATGVEATDQPRIESFAVPGSSIQRIRATVAISAPIDRVRTVVFDYGRYPEFMPRYEKASVVRTTPAGGRLVHMELGGVVHLWMRVEISPPTLDGSVEMYEGRLEKGNVKAFRPRWELEPMGSDRTRVTVESFLDPDLPLVPSAMVNSGARDGIREAILALKARIEGRRAAAQ